MSTVESHMTDVELSTTVRQGLRGLLARLPWLTRICASWVVVIIAAAIFADLIPGLPDPDYQGFLWGNDKILEPPSWDH